MAAGKYRWPYKKKAGCPMITRDIYDGLARLLAYPDDQTLGVLDRCRTSLCATVPEAADLLNRFAAQAAKLTTEKLQELYTQTFELYPICSLEVGWQLFGENYSRGEFLVEMRQTLRRLRVPETTELPDHLSLVLVAFGRMPAREADHVASKYLLPALDKMLHALSGKHCPYEYVLAAIQSLILSPYGAGLEEVAHG